MTVAVQCFKLVDRNEASRLESKQADQQLEMMADFWAKDLYKRTHQLAADEIQLALELAASTADPEVGDIVRITHNNTDSLYGFTDIGFQLIPITLG